ncbi:alpha-mannosidase 2c1 [bacterium]|nr:alpha-mannosidase 2c1 [bacterium]
MPDKFQQLHLTRIERFRDRIGKQIIRDTRALTVDYALTDTELPFPERTTLDYKPLCEGGTWGSEYQMAWLHLSGTVPAEWTGKQVVARLDIGGEGLVYDGDGKMLQGVSSGSIFDKDYARDIVPLFDTASGGETVDLWIDASANDLFGLITEMDPSAESPKRYGEWKAELKQARLVWFDTELWHLWMDLRIVLGLIRTLPEDGVRRARLIRCGSEAVDVFAEDPARASAARNVLARELGKPAAASDLNAIAIGHAHLDTAWLWPVREGKRKAERTFASQCDLIERYPGYVFGASQPHQYEYVRDRKPELWERVKWHVNNGGWEPLGGMYTEADCNLASGEALARQLLYGKRFFLDEFGVDVKHLWLPDVFGYSAALPQLLKKAGIDYFITIKISWNQFNKFPHHTFIWRGIDGSEVLAHFPPEGNYNSMLDAEYLVPGRDAFKEKDRVDVFLSSFGVGDGGGGPLPETIEYGKRLANTEGAPRVRFGRVAEFFDELETYRDQLDRWSGELYLELHRGTLTTQAKVKRGNRKLEYLLQATEMLHAFLPLSDYPAKELTDAWKTLLINQFHDILPGSSVTETYRVTVAEYRKIENTCHQLANAALRKLHAVEDNYLTVFNPHSAMFEGAVELPVELKGNSLVGEYPTRDGNMDRVRFPIQRFGGRIWTYLSWVRPFRLVSLEVSPVQADYIEFTHEYNKCRETAALVLKNDSACYGFNEQGRLIAAQLGFQRHEHQALFDYSWNAIPEGTEGNRFLLFADRPNDWDAWDVDLFYESNLLGEAECVGYESLGTGSVGSGIRFTYQWNQSTIVQDVILFRESRELRFITRVDWREDHTMLRVNFPVNVKTDRAAFDIQYGHVFRPTHRNTSWDKARFESAAHRYVDLSEQDRGVALLNDCKYGHGVHDNVISLNLLRSPSYPDPDADRGQHEFTYSLYPHEGDLVRSDVIERAACLNQPLLVWPGMKVEPQELPFTLSGKGLSLSTIKRGEDGDAWIVRIVETRGRLSNGTLRCDLPGASLVECDLIERPIGNEAESTIEFKMGPFEIRTFAVRFREEI